LLSDNRHATRTECVRSISRTIASAAPALIVVCLAGFVFAFPNQTQDIYRDIAQKIVLGPINPEAEGLVGHLGIWKEPVFGLLGVVLLCLGVRLHTQLTFAALRNTQAYLCPSSIVVQNIMPVFLAVLPILMMALGLMLARVDANVQVRVEGFLRQAYYESSIANGVAQPVAADDAAAFAKVVGHYNAMLQYSAIAMLAIGLFIGIVLFIRRHRSGRLLLSISNSEFKLYPALTVGLITASAIVIFSMAIALYPLQIALFLTPLLTFCLFCFALLASADALRRLSSVTGFPVLPAVVALPFIFTLADLNDNHAVRYNKVAHASTSKSLPTAAEEFKEWFSQRDDKNQFNASRPYPIYIVAAQGGGIYAAYHAAAFLGDVQQMCPNFAHHIFAISGVSGGSVGVSVFNALLRTAEVGQTFDTRTGCLVTVRGRSGPRFVEAASAALGNDLWSPLQAALLFPDFLQRFLFWPVPSFDRARSLEHGLEQAWADIPNHVNFLEDKKALPQLMGAPFATHWDSHAFRNVPALLLNTTEVGTGRRRVIAPFSFNGAGDLQFFPLQNDSAKQQATYQLPLSTAAILSSRFPWVTPDGWVDSALVGGEVGAKSRIVDGGYFENSGVATAVDLIKEIYNYLREHDAEKRVAINLVILTSAGFSSSQTFSPGETFGPIQTMLNTRQSRAAIEIDRAKTDLRRLMTANISFNPIEVRLRGLGYPLPLGWRLSTTTRYLIEFQLGSRLNCKEPPDPASKVIRDEGYSGSNTADCAKAAIFTDLSH
jgi:hypothetical protein